MKYNRVMPSTFQHFSWGPLKLLMKLFCSFEIKGVENVESLRGNMIIASNHISELDPMLIVSCLPFFSKHIPLYFVSLEQNEYKKEYLKGWRTKVYGGKFFRLMGSYPVYRGLNNYPEALKHHLQLIRMGKDIVIFPMGKMQSQHEPYKAKGGATFLAKETQTPLIPVLVEGISKMTFLDFLFRKRKLTVTFGKSINPNDLFINIENTDNSRNIYEKAASVLMEKIAKLSK